VKISLALPQSDLPRIQEMQRTKGLTVTVSLHDAGGSDIQVPVNFIGNAVTNTTGTIELRGSYDNPDMALVPGQLVDVTVALAEIANATLVPREAVNTGPDGVKDAVSGSLKKGDQVITEGQLRVIPGAKVSVSAAKPPAGTPGKGEMTSGRRRVPHSQDREG